MIIGWKRRSSLLKLSLRKPTTFGFFGQAGNICHIGDNTVAKGYYKICIFEDFQELITSARGLCRAHTKSIVNCRCNASFKVFALIKVICNLIGDCFEIGYKPLPSYYLQAYKKICALKVNSEMKWKKKNRKSQHTKARE